MITRALLSPRTPDEPLQQLVQQMAFIIAENAPRKPALEFWTAYALGPGVLERGPLLEEPQFLEQIAALVPTRPPLNLVLDFGCGALRNKAVLENAGWDWLGLDVAGSTDPAALARDNAARDVTLYDGRIVPFSNATFGMVWSNQSLEHVEEPELSIAEIARVLAPGGIFAGSVSFLEGFHALSTFNYSPYGFQKMCARHGLKIIKIIAYTDGLSSVFRPFALMLGYDPSAVEWPNWMRNGGPFAEALIARAKSFGANDDQIADGLAAVCGQFLFVAIKS